MNVADIRKGDCCGCTACLHCCPKRAIHMKQDEQGFLYPNINQELCIDCGICWNVCEKAKMKSEKTIEAYAAINTDDAVLKKSSSGGVSHALCKTIIERNGVVYGVGYSTDYQVEYMRCDSIDGCDILYGSKYVQADLSDAFASIRQDLESQKNVMFVGTSCYVAGLLSFLEKVKCCTEKLITIDLVCHGVPSPRLFADYIAFLNQKGNLKNFSFRTKNCPWGTSWGYGATISYKNGKQEINTPKARLFLALFGANTCLRMNCYSCKYAKVDKPADITMMDFWGVKEKHPELFSEKGVSAILVRSAKGHELIADSSELKVHRVKISDVAEGQKNLRSPSKMSNDYNLFWETYHNKGFMEVAKRWGKYSAKRRLKFIIKRLMGKL